MRRCAWLLLLAGCTDALPPEGQVLFYVNTDAPLALFDRLRIEVHPCDGDCGREFSLDAAQPWSIGIAPEPGADDHVVRVQIYRSGGTASPRPRPRSTMEGWYALPVVGEEGIVEATAMLWTDDVGTVQGAPDAPRDPLAGAAMPGVVGSWMHADRAFWMGDPRLDLSAAFDQDGELERLVVLSPFELDETEVTVAAFREAGVHGNLDPQRRTATNDCTFTETPADTEDHPINCVSWATARAYCEAVGKSLPTEAQLEWAMGADGTATYAWGNDLPQCGDAVFECPGVDGPAPIGSGARDPRDLAGNVSEWAADRWNRETEACWLPTVLVDPLCDTDGALDNPARTLRGGDWNAGELSMRAAVRTRLENENQAVSERLGFRCAR